MIMYKYTVFLRMQLMCSGLCFMLINKHIGRVYHVH